MNRLCGFFQSSNKVRDRRRGRLCRTLNLELRLIWLIQLFEKQQIVYGGTAVKAISLQIEEHPSDDELRQLVDGVRNYNRALTGYERPRAVVSILRDEQGRIIGGAHGDLWGSSVHISAMWVAKSHRGKGYGSALLTAVEQYAASRGHLLSYLETTSFQARPFYERLGYTVFGELPGIAEGCTLFLLRKELTAE
jgi:GNAT superfamily N-acetyltransferase